MRLSAIMERPCWASDWRIPTITYLLDPFVPISVYRFEIDAEEELTRDAFIFLIKIPALAQLLARAFLFSAA